jgi:hypothetical protein
MKSPCTTIVPLAQQSHVDYRNHHRPILDAHNCYPYKGRYADRIDRPLSTGFPIAIEQDMAWAVDPDPQEGRPVVSRTPKTTGAEPARRRHFFEHVRPIVEKALVENDCASWSWIILLDFKSLEPQLLRAVWDGLGAYQEWITTAPETSDPHEIARWIPSRCWFLQKTPTSKEVFSREVCDGTRLRVFGSVHNVPIATIKDGADTSCCNPAARATSCGAAN